MKRAILAAAAALTLMARAMAQPSLDDQMPRTPAEFQKRWTEVVAVGHPKPECLASWCAAQWATIINDEILSAALIITKAEVIRMFCIGDYNLSDLDKPVFHRACVNENTGSVVLEVNHGDGNWDSEKVVREGWPRL